MRDFPGLLPPTLSSEAEGWLIEAFLRSDRRVQMRDLRGRMPKEVVVPDKTGNANSQLTKPLFTMRTITQRTLRFRGLAGLKARDIRGGSHTINKRIDALIPAELLQKNNSKDLGRALKPAEIKALTKPNQGKYPQRGRREKKVANANNTSTMVTKHKRKRNSDIAESEEGNNAKKARHKGVPGNVAFQGIAPVLTGSGLSTPELSNTADSTPDFPVQSSPSSDNLEYSYPDPPVLAPYQLSSHDGLLQSSPYFPAATEGGDELDNLMNLDAHTAYRVLNGDSGSRGWNQTSYPSIHGQPYYPGVAPYADQGTHVGEALSHQWELNGYPVQGRPFQNPVATEQDPHGHNLGPNWNSNASFDVYAGYGQTYYDPAAHHTSTHGHHIEGTSYHGSGASIIPMYNRVPTAQNHGYTAEGSSYRNPGPIPGPVYNRAPEVPMAQHHGYGHADHTPASYHASTHSQSAEENLYQGPPASTRAVYSQAPEAAMAQNQDPNAVGSLLEDTVPRMPKTKSSADRVKPSRTIKGEAQQHKNRNPVDHSTVSPAVGPPVDQDEQQMAALGDTHSVSMAPNTTSRAIYTTLDGTPVYYATVPYNVGHDLWAIRPVPYRSIWSRHRRSN